MISIIGAGPVGNYLACCLAKEGFEVEVYEEHDEIGVPIQCTGILTSSIKKIIDISDEFVVNTINRIRIFSPNNNFVEINLKDCDYIVDRIKFDNYFSFKAKGLGVKYNLGWKFLGFENGLMKFNKGVRKTNILIGADGCNSKVAKVCGFGKRKIMFGLQALVKLDHDLDLVDTFLIEKGFGWVVPEGNGVCRVGLVSSDPAKNNLKSFLSKFGGFVLGYQSGPIPIYDRSFKTSKGNVYLVGDAAGMVKQTTYGGIVQGMMAAEELVKSLKTGKSYDKLWRKRIGRELFFGKMIRKKLDRFSSVDLDKLVGLVSRDKVKNVLCSVDRDHPSGILFKLMFKELRFLKYLFK